ncbi:unnamed protein product [Cochlearia groenlandica]
MEEEEEARRALANAEIKLSENDYKEAKKLINKANSLCPTLDGLKQVLMIIDVHISASNKIYEEPDWYGILGVDPLVAYDCDDDDEYVKKQYKKLALLLHPDKNMFHGAESAFKLVLEAWSVLSDKSKRIKFDRKWRSEHLRRKRKCRPEKPPIPQKPNPNPKSNPNHMHKPSFVPRPNHNMPRPNHMRKPSPKPKPEPDYSSVKRQVTTFWTKCDRCETHCEYVRENYLEKTLPCPNCGHDFVAAEIRPEIINGRPFIILCPSNKPTSKTTSDDTSSSSSSSSWSSTSNTAKATTHHKRMKRWFEPNQDEYSSKTKVSKFWTVCNTCKTICKLVRTSCLNKTLPCQACGEIFAAAEMIPEVFNGSPAIRLSTYFRPASKTSTHNASSSSSSSKTSGAKDSKQEEGKAKRWFQESREKIAAEVAAAAASDGGGNAEEAERIFMKMMTGKTNSAFKTEST